MKTALVCVSFGTSVAEARRSIAAVEEALRAELPQARFVRAFTSPTIRRALAARGEEVWSFPQALEHLAQEGRTLYVTMLARPGGAPPLSDRGRCARSGAAAGRAPG